MKKTSKIIFIFLILVLGTMAPAFAVEELVLNTEAKFHPTYENRFSFLVGFNPSVTKAGDVTNFAFSYGKKLEDYWFSSSLILTNGVFNKISTNNPSATGLTNDQLFATKSTLTTFGIGLGRESRYAQTLLPISDLYEYMSADLTYNLFKESVSAKSFGGPGMLAKFSLYKKFSEYFSAGTQFTYNLAVVKRAQDNDLETSSVRSLTMSYLTVGFDFCFFL